MILNDSNQTRFMQKYVATFFLLVMFGKIHGQYQANLPQSKPISPNAAALFKTMEKPLGSYTGTVPISFPLGTVTSGSLSVDLALNYTSTGGIKVEELAGSVGLGWNLADGAGRITRIIRGFQDESAYGLVNNNNVKPSAFNCGNMTQVYETQQGLNVLDLEPDIYMYSFNGRSGKFFIKEDGSVVLMQNEGIKITYTVSSGVFDTWKITDENGNTYHFGSYTYNEASYTSSGGSTSSSTTSDSWYLTEIDDMNGENTIKFDYTGSSTSFTTLSGIFYPLDIYAPLCTGFNWVSTIGTVTTTSMDNVVSRIYGRSGYVVFTTAPDYSGGPKSYTKMQMYDSSGNLKKYYNFNYNSTSFSSNRRKLKNFSEFGSSGTDSIATAFTYIETVNLPAVISYAVVSLEYYNGASTNTGYLPNVVYKN